MTFEFNILEPAAFHLWAMTDVDNSTQTTTLTKPIHPKDVEVLLGKYKTGVQFSSGNLTENFKPLLSFEDITELNYKYWAAAYGIEAELPPPEIVSK